MAAVSSESGLRDTSVLNDVGVEGRRRRRPRVAGPGGAPAGGSGDANGRGDSGGVDGFFGPGAEALAAAAARERDAQRLLRRKPAPVRTSSTAAFALYGVVCGGVTSVVLFTTFAFSADMVSSELPTFAYVLGGGLISFVVGVYMGAAYEWNWGVGRAVGVAGAVAAAAVDGLVFRLLTGRPVDAVVVGLSCGGCALVGTLLGASVEN